MRLSRETQRLTVAKRFAMMSNLHGTEESCGGRLGAEGRAANVPRETSRRTHQWTEGREGALAESEAYRMSDDLETAWSPSTGWTNGNGRYLAVPPHPPQASAEEVIAECRAVNPPPAALHSGRAPDDIQGTMGARVFNQVREQWIGSQRIAQRLRITSKDRTAYQTICRELRQLYADGAIERKNEVGAGYHKFGTWLYRRRESR